MYAPVMHVGTKMWMVGRIENHSVAILSLEEVDDVCEQLNGIVKQPTEIALKQCGFYDKCPCTNKGHVGCYSTSPCFTERGE